MWEWRALTAHASRAGEHEGVTPVSVPNAAWHTGSAQSATVSTVVTPAFLLLHSPGRLTQGSHGHPPVHHLLGQPGGEVGQVPREPGDRLPAGRAGSHRGNCGHCTQRVLRTQMKTGQLSHGHGLGQTTVWLPACDAEVTREIPCHSARTHAGADSQGLPSAGGNVHTACPPAVPPRITAQETTPDGTTVLPGSL